MYGCIIIQIYFGAVIPITGPLKKSAIWSVLQLQISFSKTKQILIIEFLLLYNNNKKNHVSNE